MTTTADRFLAELFDSSKELKGFLAEDDRTAGNIASSFGKVARDTTPNTPNVTPLADKLGPPVLPPQSPETSQTMMKGMRDATDLIAKTGFGLMRKDLAGQMSDHKVIIAGLYNFYQAIAFNSNVPAAKKKAQASMAALRAAHTVLPGDGTQ